MTPSWVNRGELCIFCPTPEPEVDTETVTHWGVLLRGGNIRWDPSYGSGNYVPYTEVQARDDARRSGGTVVTRTQTTTLTTTAWVEA